MRWGRILLVLAATACGGGGASLPTEAGSGSGAGSTGSEQEEPGRGGTHGSRPPSHVSVAVSDEYGFAPDSVTVATRGSVSWTVVKGRHDITFLGPAPADGSIGETRSEETVTRRFDEPGTYRYVCARHDDEGERGVIVVAGDATDDPGGTAVVVRTPGNRFDPATVAVEPGVEVTWEISGTRHNVYFTGAAPSGGNIPDTEPGTSVRRLFELPGRYDYVCTRHSGMNGTVVVQ
jgi:plastocyanin